MTTLDALQTTLAAEHAAVHVLGALGARARGRLRTSIAASYAVHRARRDQLTSYVRDEGGEPVAAEAAYALPDDLDSAAGLTSGALEVEDACAETYAWLVANATGARRRWAVTALTDTAVRVLSLRESPEIFPGAGEYADR